jgi:hypothetical protein
MADKEVISKWLVALRSGDYKQGQFLLRDIDDNFCCLGVACDVIGYEPIISEDDKFYEYNGDGAVITDKTQDILGLHGAIVGTLMALNDDEKDPFPKIADHLEMYYKQKGIL